MKKMMEAGGIAGRASGRIRATSHYRKRVLMGNPGHPLAEAIAHDHGNAPLPHLSNETVKSSESGFLIQKYESNAILMLTTSCPQKCSYCFRKTDEKTVITRQELRRVFADIRKAESLLEIVLSGGEPLSVSPKLLSTIAKEADSLNETRKNRLIITIHTRLPVVAPSMLNRGRLEAMKALNPANLDLHIIHPDEVTKELLAACRALSKELPGISLRAIHPLLRGINDDPATLRELYVKLLLGAGIVPRDLILSMPGPTPENLLVALEDGMRIERELSVLVPGHLLPRLVVCSPVYGKSYVDPFHLKKDGTFGYDVREDGLIAGMFVKDGSALQHSSAALLR